MMTALEETSTITSKGQTTIPKSVRQALAVDFGGRIIFRIDDSGVSVHRAESKNDDPAIDSFLAFLARDTEHHPERIIALSSTLAAHIATLTEGMDTNLDAEITGIVDL